MKGVPLDGPSKMFGNEESVIKPSTIPYSTLNMQHNALSYITIMYAYALRLIFFLNCLVVPPSGHLYCHSSFGKRSQIKISVSMVIHGIKADSPIGSRRVIDRNSN
jgi:hypothetical protein